MFDHHVDLQRGENFRPNPNPVSTSQAFPATPSPSPLPWSRKFYFWAALLGFGGGLLGCTLLRQIPRFGGFCSRVLGLSPLPVEISTREAQSTECGRDPGKRAASVGPVPGTPNALCHPQVPICTQGRLSQQGTTDTSPPGSPGRPEQKPGLPARSLLHSTGAPPSRPPGPGRGPHLAGMEPRGRGDRRLKEPFSPVLNSPDFSGILITTERKTKSPATESAPPAPRF